MDPLTCQPLMCILNHLRTSRLSHLNHLPLRKRPEQVNHQPLERLLDQVNYRLLKNLLDQLIHQPLRNNFTIADKSCFKISIIPDICDKLKLL